MIEIEQDLQAFFDNVMRLAIMHVRNKADAAGIFLIRRIIKAMRFGKSGIENRYGRLRHMALSGERRVFGKR